MAEARPDIETGAATYVGWLLVVAGVVWVALALRLDVSVPLPEYAQDAARSVSMPDRVANVELLNQRLVHTIAGFGTVLVGMLSLVIDAVKSVRKSLVSRR